VNYVLSVPTVQTKSTYTIKIETPVKLEISPNGGCYVKFNFPDELLIRANELTVYTGGYLMVGKDDTTINQ
jgi:hypothetical protein